MATRVVLNQSQNFEFIRFTQNPVIIPSHRFAHNLELVTSGADKRNQPNVIITIKRLAPKKSQMFTQREWRSMP